MLARPPTTGVEEYTMHSRSASGVLSGSAYGSLSTGSDSPVRADSSMRRSSSDTIRPSAGTRSPVSSVTRSPGTTSAASMSLTSPSRSTRACGLESLRRASSAASARYSCTTPMITLAMTIIRMTIASNTFPARTETTPAPASRYTIGLAIWLTMSSVSVTPESTSREFGP